jgi:DNA (cytosine-5)-methyltransferase 1
MDASAAALAGWSFSPAGLLIPPPARPQYGRPIGVGLYAGAGGMDLGCHQAGFHMAAAAEIDPTAALTYLVNLARPGVKIHFDNDEREEQFTRVLDRHLGLRRSASRGQDGLVIRSGPLAGSGWISGQPPDVRGCEHFFVADCRNLTGKQILDALGLERGQVALVCGGPPCQGFSKANSKRSVMDPRNSLVFEFARLVLEIWPKTFMMENVPQVATMLTPEGVPVIDALARVMADGGFSSYDALKASLHAQVGVGALQREAHTPHRAKARNEPGAGRSDQLGLFGPDDEELPDPDDEEE